MKNSYRKFAIAAVLASALSGCETMQDLVGKHMPVIGEPCENWQCFTSGGQAQSEATRRAREARARGETTGRTPINGEEGGQAPQQPPHAKELTPFDMPPDQLDNMPTHDPE